MITMRSSCNNTSSAGPWPSSGPGDAHSPLSFDRGGLTFHGELGDEPVEEIVMFQQPHVFRRCESGELRLGNMTGNQCPGLGLGCRVLIAHDDQSGDRNPRQYLG